MAIYIYIYIYYHFPFCRTWKKAKWRNWHCQPNMTWSNTQIHIKISAHQQTKPINLESFTQNIEQTAKTKEILERYQI